MSDDGTDSGSKPTLSEEDVIKDVEERCYAAFKEYDRKGTGGRVSSERIAGGIFDSSCHFQRICFPIYEIVGRIECKFCVIALCLDW